MPRSSSAVDLEIWLQSLPWMRKFSANDNPRSVKYEIVTRATLPEGHGPVVLLKVVRDDGKTWYEVHQPSEGPLSKRGPNHVKLETGTREHHLYVAEYKDGIQRGLVGPR